VDRFDDQSQKPVIGDILVLAGCVCYGISNVGQEYMVKASNRDENEKPEKEEGKTWKNQGAGIGRSEYHVVDSASSHDHSLVAADAGGLGEDSSDKKTNGKEGGSENDNKQNEKGKESGGPGWMEFVSMIGCYGTVISAIQIAVAERQPLRDVDWSDPLVWVYLTGFTICLYLLYVCVPVLLSTSESSAILMNLSFLTADFWSLLIAVFLFSAHLHGLYFVAFSIIILGLMIYHLASTSIDCSCVAQSHCCGPNIAN